MKIRRKKALLELWNYRSWDPGKWFSYNVGSAEKGLVKMGYEIAGFHSSDLKNAPLDRRTIVKGSIHTVRTALWLLGCEQPQNIDIPDPLMKYTNRTIWKTNMGEIRKISPFQRVFIKPLDVQKGFKGHVFNQYNYATNNLPNKYKVLASEVVDFQAEWRVYILRGEILGIRRYSECTNGYRPPSRRLVQEMIRAWKDAPVAYAMDIGVVMEPDGECVYSLVEVNEGFSLGNYGIPHLSYAKMVEARWKEMTNT